MTMQNSTSAKSRNSAINAGGLKNPKIPMPGEGVKQSPPAARRGPAPSKPQGFAGGIKPGKC